MAKFSKGNIVKVTDNDRHSFGEILIVNQDDDTSPYCLDVNGIFRGSWDEDTLTLATGYDAIVKGTVLKQRVGGTRKVLGIIGDLYACSSLNEEDALAGWWSRREVEDVYLPPTPTEDKGIEVFDKDHKSLGFMKEGKVITN